MTAVDTLPTSVMLRLRKCPRLFVFAILMSTLWTTDATVKPHFHSQTYVTKNFQSDVQMYNSRRFADLIESSLENLPYGLHLYSSVAINSDGIITSGTDVFLTGVFKLNHKEMCQHHEECPEMRFSWNRPAWVREAGLDFADIRVFVDAEPVRYLKKPDDEVYISTLTIEQAGGIHTGLWSCSFKFFSRDNGKLDRKELPFRLNIDGLAEGQMCGFNDHCFSGNCVAGKCVCNEEAAVFDKLTNQCYAAADFNEPCSNSKQCQAMVTGSICSCPSEDPLFRNSGTECSKTCHCDERLVPVHFASNINQCLAPAKLAQVCESSDQCSAMDRGTYCSFDQRCECRDGASCSTSLVPTTCDADTDCTATEYCSSGRCRHKRGLNQECSKADDCAKNDSKSTCASGSCRCVEGYKASARGTCITMDSCVTNVDCEDTSGYCQDGLCLSGTRLGVSCTRQSACRAADLESFCSANNVCECKQRYRVVDGVCLSDVHCLRDEDCSRSGPNHRCVDNRCNRPNDGKCQNSTQCLELSLYSFCSPVTRACECDGNFERSSNGTCVPRTCSIDSECSGGMFCRDYKCSCKDNYEANVYGYCMGKKKDKPDDGKDSSDKLFKWFDEWTWQAYAITGGLGLVMGLLLSLIICLFVRIVRQATRRSRDFGAGNENNGISHSAETLPK